jgi:hypothetical protein
MQYLASFLQDTGNNSLMRALAAMIVVGVLVVWVAANIAMAWDAIAHDAALAIVPMTKDMLWAIGIALGGKTAQAVAERTQTLSPDPPKQ